MRLNKYNYNEQEVADMLSKNSINEMLYDSNKIHTNLHKWYKNMYGQEGIKKLNKSGILSDIEEKTYAIENIATNCLYTIQDLVEILYYIKEYIHNRSEYESQCNLPIHSLPNIINIIEDILPTDINKINHNTKELYKYMDELKNEDNLLVVDTNVENKETEKIFN